ncbi:MAG: polymer-forming cytoskeletal protein [Alphaproteobacteria bacterium]|jgi:cytoskeletal protein CcmA (bactofilin family)|nr:polymer-forming cytoskeletal protein [Alphaproteobacteria bacterium]
MRSSSSNPLSPDLPRRHADIPPGPRRRSAEEDPTGRIQPDHPPQAQTGPAAAEPAAQPPAGGRETERRLIVGKEITLSGEISACDHLVVEGRIEAQLKDCRTIEVYDSGVFKGAADIEDADIGGRFEGELSVRGRLKVRSTGLITGTIHYGRLEVEGGGQLIGTVRPLDQPATDDPATGRQVPAGSAGADAPAAPEKPGAGPAAPATPPATAPAAETV